ncbi:MAG: GH92 family glycosyl hydrolase, partial [Limisphaerales bacterium]
MKKQFVLFHFILIICAFTFSRIVAFAETNDLASFVNPFVGTDNSGDTYPGAVASFGSVQMTPNLAGNGYYYHDTHMH